MSRRKKFKQLWSGYGAGKLRNPQYLERRIQDMKDNDPKLQLPGGDFRGFEGNDQREYDDYYSAFNGHQRTTPVAAEGWTTNNTHEPKCAKACDYRPKMEGNEISIVLGPAVQEAIQSLREHIKIEWQMLLSGEVVIEGTNEYVRCIGYYIPKQVVGPAHVKNMDCIDAEFIRENKIIATIHSHADMAVFFSGTDEEDCCANSTIKYHMTTNNRHEFHAAKAAELPCGKMILLPAKVWLAYREKPTGFENIETRTYRRD